MSTQKIIINRDDLYNQVWSKPMTALAKEYGISDVGLANVCKKLNIPRPESGHWAKVQAGKDVTIVKLPSLKPGETDTYELNPEDNSKIDLPEEILELIVKERMPENKIVIPEKYIRYHKMINNIVKEKTVKYFSNNPYNSSFRNNFGFKITDSSFDRALKIFDALIKALETRGYAVITKTAERGKDTFIVINGSELKIILSEKLKQTPAKEYDVNRLWNNKFENIPSGILKLEIDEYFSPYETETKAVRDTPTQKLEDRLNEFIIALLKGSEAKKKREEFFEQERIKAQKEEGKRQALLHEIKNEKKKLEKFLDNIKTYYQSYQMRLYIKAVEDDFVKKNGEILIGSDIEKWIKWANDQADRVDPLKDSPPSVLDNANKFSSWELGR
ncbi:MAG: hypothetical protein RDU14_13600 [Melioribacteraceae bacterium]|nr:hypothetical protein [Melioribacteraceae bacterium]